MPGIIDFILAFILIIAFPLLTWHGYGKFKRRIAAGDVNARAREYIQTMAWQWGLSAVVIVVWLVAGRAWSALGFIPDLDWQFWLGAAITGILTGFFIYQQYSVRGATGEKREQITQQLRTQLKPVKDIMPHTPREMRLFAGVSITAGTCEELLYRAYLIWFVSSFMGLIAAATVSIVIFAAAHLYQGVLGALRVLVVGAAMTGLYLLTDCIWLPMLLHATIDLTSGLMGYHVLREEAE